MFREPLCAFNVGARPKQHEAANLRGTFEALVLFDARSAEAPTSMEAMRREEKTHAMAEKVKAGRAKNTAREAMLNLWHLACAKVKPSSCKQS